MAFNNLNRVFLVAAGCVAMVVVAAGSGGAAQGAAGNPLLEKWSGPYDGVPAFDRYKVEQFKPALEAAMAEQLAEIERIAKDPAPPTFDNTITALERAGRTFARVATIYGVYSATLSTPEFQAVEQEMAPRLAEFLDRISQNEPLFKRIAAVYDARESSRLSPEQKRLAWLDYTDFVRSGAKLDVEAKKRLAEINQRLATLFTTFSQNVLADETDYVTALDSEADLAGLPDSIVTALGDRRRARAEGPAGRSRTPAPAWSRSSPTPSGATCARRSGAPTTAAATTATPGTTTKIITEILKLRAERARLLGYETHAHWRLEDQMASTPERAMELMEGRVEAGRGPRARGGRRHAGDRRQGGRGHPDRALGLPLLRREGAQGEVRPRPERGQAVPAAREAARGDVLGRRPAVRAPVLAGLRRCRSCSRTSESSR